MFAVINSTILIILLTINPLFAQTKSDSTIQKSDTIEEFFFVDEMAQFPGGESQLYAFIGKKLKYPKKAIKNNIKGKVVVQFVINQDGTISEVTTLGKKIGYGLEEEAMRVVQAMPKWIPAKQKGKPVRMRYRLPINFELDVDEIKPAATNQKRTHSNPKRYDLP